MGKPGNTAMLVAAGAGAIGLGSPAGAQTIQGGWEIRVSNAVSPSQPTATVEVWAWFDFVPGVSDLFTGGDFDLVAGEGEFWNFVFPLLRPDPGPIVRGSSIIGVVAFQLHIPALGIFGDTSNPIHVFSADWTTSNLLTPRTIDLRSENTTSFFVAAFQTGQPTQLFPQGFVPGSGMITVIPSPASGGLAFVFVLHRFARRRRERKV